MKKIIGLTIAAIMVVVLVGIGTWAYFSDTETSIGNTFTAGTLNLENVISGTAVNSSIVVTELGDGLNDKVEFGLTDPVKPGSNGSIAWTLSNTGNLAGNLTMVSTTTFDEGGAPNEPELAADPDSSDGLGEKLMVWVTRGGTDILGNTSTYVAMSGLEAVLDAENQSIAGGGSLVYVLHWQIPTATGNEIQGDTATLDITFTLTQS